MQKTFDLFLLSAYTALIFWLSNQQTLPKPDLFEYEDKLQHFIAYFVMGVLAWRAFGHWPVRRESLFLLSFIFCVIYGLSDEWHQSFVIGRHASAMDWLADSLGGLVAAFVCHLRQTARSTSDVTLRE